MATISVILVDDSPLCLEQTSAWLSRQKGLAVVGSANSAAKKADLATELLPCLRRAWSGDDRAETR